MNNRSDWVPLLPGEGWSSGLIRTSKRTDIRIEQEVWLPPAIHTKQSAGLRLTSGTVDSLSIPPDFFPGLPDLLTPDCLASLEEGIFRAASVLRTVGGYRLFHLTVEQEASLILLPGQEVITSFTELWRLQLALENRPNRLPPVWKRWGGHRAPAPVDCVKLALSVVNDPLSRMEWNPAPEGNLPVILGPGWPGLIFHEAVGHALEADNLLQGQSWLRPDLLGSAVANPLLTLSDDGTLPDGRGTAMVDDEGSPVTRTVLIERGRLKTFLTHRQSAGQLGLPVTGNARCENGTDMPVVRMRNLIIESGKDDPAAMIRSIRSGLLITDLEDGHCDPRTGQFTFPAGTAFLIRDGKLKGRVKGVHLGGSGPETLNRIVAIGPDGYLDPSAGWCIRSGQVRPVSIGQPSVLISSLTVTSAGKK